MKWSFLGVVFLLTPVFYSHASALYIDPALNSINQGDVVVLSVRLDVDEAVGECVNAVDGVIEYSENLQLIDTSIGNSIFPIWVETPTINEALRQVTFAGGIPNGYCGRVVGDPQLTNVLTQLVFRAVVDPAASSTTTGVVTFTDASTVYLNDGFGTPLSTQNYGAEITIAPVVGSEVQDPWQDSINDDQIPPEIFSINLERDDTTFQGNYYIVFNTTDKQSGMSYYEVMEEPLDELNLFRFGAATAPWVKTRSPYQLKDQTLNSTIRVRAVDKAGNEYIATLIPDESLRTMNVTSASTLFFIATALFVGVIFLIIFVWYRARRKANINHHTNSYDI